MTDKIVTHADLSMLRDVRALLVPEQHKFAAFVDRLIAAAEADAPPLPEGWVVYTDDDGDERVLWHRDGVLYYGRGDYAAWPPNADDLARCAPLRPTITEADVERARSTIWRETRYMGSSRADEITRAALKAAGIEVQP